MLQCQFFRWIEAPLKPIFLRPFSADQTEHIMRAWHNMRYIRVDLMRQLGGEEVFLGGGRQNESLSAHPDYLLSQRSLKKLLGYVWMATARPPDYLRIAFKNQTEAQTRLHQLIAVGMARERRLRHDRSMQFQQTEYLSFLIAVLLESPSCLRTPLANGVGKKTESITEQVSVKEVMPMRQQ